ncbi:MAG: DUF2141 domain-containing protein [Candidatus Binatia bacterium]|nr:DUF2141 domain-containing protein [Candidatus Binatia bacterium]
MASQRALILGLGLTCGLAFATLAVAEDAQTSTLTLVATGFDSDDGEALIQLANSQADYESDDEGFRVAKIKPVGNKVETTFEDLAYGEYGIKIFHDENGNGELDIGWTGPEEGYGFSNDARALMGPPDWEDAKFTVSEPTQAIEIELK